MGGPPKGQHDVIGQINQNGDGSLTSLLKALPNEGGSGLACIDTANDAA